MVWAKAAVCSEVMRAGYDVFWSDADAIWFQSPFPLLAQHPEVDLIPPQVPWQCSLNLRHSSQTSI